MSDLLRHMKKASVLCFSVLCLISTLSLALSLSAAQEATPYIYYPYGDGYIIERADGTDSHFAGGVIGAFASRLDATWSPSGAWVAWRAVDHGGCGESGEPAEQLVIAGAGTAALLPYDWVRFTWSPMQDRLFVIGGDSNGSIWQILDPAAPDTPVSSGEWSGDETAPDALQTFFRPLVPGFAENNRLEEAAVSADGRWLAYIDDGPVLVDRESGETRLIAPSVYGFGGNRGGYIEWHPTQNWFISVEEGVAGCGSSYYTQVTDGETRYEAGAFRDIAWLPRQVDPALFPAFRRPAEPEPVAVFHAQDWITALQWSSDGAILYGYSGFGNPLPLAAWEVQTGLPPTGAEFPAVMEVPESYYLQDRRVLAESGRYVVIPNEVYDKQSGERVLSVGVDLWTMGGEYQISADERIMIGTAILEPLRIWSLPDGGLRFEGLVLTAASLSPDASVVAVASGWDVRLYSRESLGF